MQRLTAILSSLPSLILEEESRLVDLGNRGPEKPTITALQKMEMETSAEVKEAEKTVESWKTKREEIVPRLAELEERETEERIKLGWPHPEGHEAAVALAQDILSGDKEFPKSLSKLMDEQRALSNMDRSLVMNIEDKESGLSKRRPILESISRLIELKSEQHRVYERIKVYDIPDSTAG